MRQKDTVHEQDLTRAVDGITAQFYRKSQSDDTGNNDTQDVFTTTDDAAGSPPIDTYLQFSATHRRSNHLLVGVLLFFFLIISVWGFLWYQTVQSTPIRDSFDMSILNRAGDDISSIMAQFQSDIDTEVARTNEAKLKSDLSTAIQEQLQAATTRTTTTDTPTPLSE